jgi:hypothetical protein
MDKVELVGMMGTGHGTHATLDGQHKIDIMAKLNSSSAEFDSKTSAGFN